MKNQWHFASILPFIPFSGSHFSCRRTYHFAPAGPTSTNTLNHHSSQGEKGAAARDTSGVLFTRPSKSICDNTVTSNATRYQQSPGVCDDFWLDATQPLLLPQARILPPSADDYCKAQSPLAPEQDCPVIPAG